MKRSLRSSTCHHYLLLAALVFPILGISRGEAQAEEAGKLADYDFEDTGTTAWNQGAGRADLSLTLKGSATTSPVEIVTGTANRVLDLSANAGMGGVAVAFAEGATTSGKLVGLPAMTIAGWFKPESSPTNGTILLRNSGASHMDGWALAFSGSQQLRLTVGSGTSATVYSSSGTAYNAGNGNWQFFAVSWSGSAAIWYKGTSSSQPAVTGTLSATTTMGTTPQRLLVGRANSSSGAFDGRLDNLAVYNASLDATAITAEYNRKNNPPRLPFPSAWDGGSDLRTNEARLLYLPLLDRALSESAAKLPTGRYEQRETVSAIHHHYIIYGYGRAYRASLLPNDHPLRQGYITEAKNVLFDTAEAIIASQTNSVLREAQGGTLRFGQGALVKLYRLLKPELSPADQQYIYDPAICWGGEMVPKEYGSFNRASCAAYGLQATANEFSGNENVDNWRNFSDEVWDDWKHVNDTFEDAHGYNGLWLLSTLLQAEERGEQFVSDTGAKTFFGRFVHLVAPNGAMPDYGAGNWDHARGLWPYALERFGKICNSKEFLDASLRLGYFIERQPDIDLSQTEGLIETCRAITPVTSATSSPLPAATVTVRKTDCGDSIFDKLYVRTGTTPTDAYACFDLHDQGYHGYADAGALLLYTSGSSVLLHALGHAGGEADFLFPYLQQGAWVSTGTQNFLSAPTPGTNAWTTWLVHFRSPGTYAGGRTLNIAQITNAFLRAKVSGTFSGTMTVDVDPVIAVSQQYSATGTIFSATTQIHPGWHGTNVYASGAGHPFFSAAPTLNTSLSNYNCLLVKWRSSHPQFVDYFGLNGKALSPLAPPGSAATFRCRPGSLTIAAYANPANFGGGLCRIMLDVAGRPVKHQRDVGLRQSDGALAVLDTFEFLEAGTYTVGSVWHSEEISGMTSSSVVASNVQMNQSGTAKVRFDFATSGTASGGTGTFTILTGTFTGRYGNAQKRTFAPVWTGSRGANQKVSICSFLRPGEPAETATLNVGTVGTAIVSDVSGTLQIPQQPISWQQLP